MTNFSNQDILTTKGVFSKGQTTLNSQNSYRDLSPHRDTHYEINAFHNAQQRTLKPFQIMT